MASPKLAAPRKLSPIQELGDGDNAPSLRAAVRDEPGPFETELLRYLRAGAPLVIAGSYGEDVLTGERTVPQSVETDGTWLWPGGLAYYVERYHVLLPDEFVAHAAALDWTPPTLSDERIMEIVEINWPDRA